MNERLLNKIKGLLNKAKDSACTEAEAASCINLANKLMMQHNIGISDIPDEEVEKSKVNITGLEDYVDNVTHTIKWQPILLQGLAMINNCKVLLSMKDNGVWLIGNELDRFLVLETYHSLSSLIKSHCAAALVTYREELALGIRHAVPGFQAEYCLGMARRLVEKIQELDTAIRNHHTTELAIVEYSLVVKEAINDYLDNQGMTVGNGRTLANNSNSEAYSQGYTEGGSVDNVSGQQALTH